MMETPKLWVKEASLVSIVMDLVMRNQMEWSELIIKLILSDLGGNFWVGNWMIKSS